MKNKKYQFMFLISIALFCGIVKTKTIYATESSVVIKDQNGMVITQDENEIIQTMNSLYFYLNNEELREGECFVFRLSTDGGVTFSTLNPVSNGIYEMVPSNSGEYEVNQILFYCYQIQTGEIRTLIEGERAYTVIFEEQNAKATFASDGGKVVDGITYIRGKKPKLTVKAAQAYDTYIEIENEIEKRLYYIRNKSQTVYFNEGNYGIKVYYINSVNEKILVGGYPAKICYDCSEPTNPSFFVKLAGGGNYSEFSEYQYRSNDEIEIQVKAEDSLSGIDKIVFKYEGKMKEKGDTLFLSKGFKGNVYAKAIDLAGNESPWIQCLESFMVEDESPEVTMITSEEEDIINIQLHALDDESGIEKMECYFNNQRIFESEEKIQEGLESILQNLKLERTQFKQEGNLLKVVVSDLAGNQLISETNFYLIDERAPMIQFTGCTNYEVKQEPVSLQILISDKHLDNSSIQKQVIRMDEYGNIKSIVPFQNNLITLKEEGNYSVLVKAKDTYQNQSNACINFTIDLSAPTISGLSQYQGKYLKEFSLANSLQSMLADYSMIRYRAYLNGKDFDEKFIVTEQGKYLLKIEAVDQMGNEKVEKAEFIIDRIPPTISISRKGKEIFINLENKQDIISSVIIDGKEVMSAQKKHTFSYVVKNLDKVTVYVEATDQASNQIHKWKEL
ncbi:MAG: Ig-like domain-containing protein [Lachnospiraceae bacterium]|nr:Ig-like domain-containing protein [Lachnospiraceae bacterium]